MSTATLDPITLPKAQQEQVSELKNLMQKEGKARLVGKGGEPAVELPDTVYNLLLQILSLMQQQKAITIVPITQELTTQQAADLLRVSRPYLVKLVEAGMIPFHHVGTHRRIYLRDLMDYKQRRDAERHDALNQMAREAVEAGLYDKVLLPDNE